MGCQRPERAVFHGILSFLGIRRLLPHFSRGCSPVFFKSSVHGLDAAKACQFGNFPDAQFFIQIFGGYINTTFGIYTMKEGERQTWLFRMYKRGKNLDALLYEHRLLLHARKNGFTFGAAPLINNLGQTYCQYNIWLQDQEEGFLFAVFNYVDGKDLID